MSNVLKLVLASSSPRRKWLLEREGICCEIIPSHVEEGDIPGHSPVELAATHARNKAFAVAKNYPEHLIVGADTVVAIDGQCLGKPTERKHAEGMLAKLSGRTHEVITAVMLVSKANRIAHAFHEISSVTFRQMTAADISNYLSLIHPFDKAGGYAAQEHADLIIERIEGLESNVIGLPVERLIKEFHTLGVVPAG